MRQPSKAGARRPGARAAALASAAPAPAPNALRGEAALTLEGVTYLLRPSFEALVEIEKQAGSTLSDMALAASRGGVPLATLGIIAAELIKAGGRAAGDQATAHVGARKIAELIQEAGMLGASITLARVLTDAVTGGYTASGEAKAMTGQ